MIGWVSLLAILLIVLTLGWGWYKGWSVLFTLIISMGAVFVLGLATSPVSGVSIVRSSLLQELAWRPDYLSLGAWTHWWTALTAMFLHADVMHFLVNVVVFVFIGMGFEERVGRGRFLLVFLLTGLFGTVLHSVTNLEGFARFIPVVGASGAVFGVIGAYATMFPRDRVVLFFFLIIPNVPVYIAALLYTAMELIAIEGFGGGGGNVAHHAHLGGLIMGVFMALFLMRIAPVERERGAARPASIEYLEPLLATEEQRHLYERLEANLDEPELAQAWLEKLARATPCPRCQSRLEAARGALRCSCGYKLPLNGKKKPEKGKRAEE